MDKYKAIRQWVEQELISLTNEYGATTNTRLRGSLDSRCYELERVIEAMDALNEVDSNHLQGTRRTGWPETAGKQRETMSEWGLEKSFGVDNGELDDFERHECFVLGYELALVDERLKSGEAFSMPIHVANRPRVILSCKGRLMSMTFCHDDPSEDWTNLVVYKRD